MPTSSSHNQLFRVLLLVAALAAAWLLWSGLYKPHLLALGALSLALSLWFARRIGTFREASPFLTLLDLPRFWAWLLVEIVKSSIDVARIILSPKLPISPALVEFDTACKGPIGQVILGNAITLSPGTVTLDVYADRIKVHCLTAQGAEAIRSGEADRRAAQITEF